MPRNPQTDKSEKSTQPSTKKVHNDSKTPSSTSVEVKSKQDKSKDMKPPKKREVKLNELDIKFDTDHELSDFYKVVCGRISRLLRQPVYSRLGLVSKSSLGLLTMIYVNLVEDILSNLDRVNLKEGSKKRIKHHHLRFIFENVPHLKEMGIKIGCTLVTHPMKKKNRASTNTEKSTKVQKNEETESKK